MLTCSPLAAVPVKPSLAERWNPPLQFQTPAEPEVVASAREVDSLPPSASTSTRTGPSCVSDDLDDTADGVSPEERALRPSHDLDAFDVGERELRQVEPPPNAFSRIPSTRTSV